MWNDKFCDTSGLSLPGGRTPPLLVGYARISTDDLTLQRTALKQAGCKRLYEEKVSGAKRDLPALPRMLDQLREGDVGRRGCPARPACALNARPAGDRGDPEGGRHRPAQPRGPWADTTSPAGKMVLTVFAGMAEFERALIHQRTSSGRVAARTRGVRFGRPPKLTPEQIALGRRMPSCHPLSRAEQVRPSEETHLGR